MMRKIYARFIVSKAIGKVSMIVRNRIEPIPIHKIMADSRSPISQAVRLKMKDQLPPLRTFRAKCPI